jgi:predicted outer membrane repeat protein
MKASIIAVVFVTLCALPRTAAANPIIVGDGTAGSCTENALRNAIFEAGVDGGGTIRFNCGAAPVVISLVLVDTTVPALTLPNNVLIDGGGLVTLEAPILDGSHSVGVYVPPNTSVTIENLTFVALEGSLDFSGSAVRNEGTLSIVSSTLTEKRVCGDVICIKRSPLLVTNGTLNVKNSTFTGIGRDDRSAIGNAGTATIDSSAFLGNRGEFGSAIANGGTLEVTNSIFINNVADFDGGAIVNGGTLTIDNSEFTGNVGTSSIGGGAIRSGGSLAVTNSTFRNNMSGAEGGGAIYYRGAVTIDNSEFFDNRGGFGGAIFGQGEALIQRSTFSGNHAFDGGAIYTYSPITLVNSTITANTAFSDGGGIFVNGTFTGAVPTLIRTTVTGNTPNDVVVVPSTTAVTTTAVQ